MSLQYYHNSRTYSTHLLPLKWYLSLKGRYPKTLRNISYTLARMIKTNCLKYLKHQLKKTRYCCSNKYMAMMSRASLIN